MRSVLLVPALLAGCGDIPRDPGGTLETISATRRIRVGEVAGAERGDLAAARRVVGRLSARTGATPAVTVGTLEPLLLRLEAGQLDLVLGGRFDRKTPWARRVALGLPYRRRSDGAGTTAAHLVARNGENGWITLVERATRAGESGR